MTFSSQSRFFWRSLATALALVFYMASGSAMAAPGDTVGPAQQVSSLVVSSQLARNASGSFVVVFQQDFGAKQIFGRRYAVNGAPLDSEFPISVLRDCCGPPVRNPKVAISDSGRFAVVWQEAGDEFETPRLIRLRARVFSADGVPETGVFAVDPAEEAGVRQGPPSIAMDPAGNFIIAWRRGGTCEFCSNFGAVRPIPTEQVVAQRYSADGAPQGARIAASAVRGLDLTSRAVVRSHIVEESVGVAVDERGGFVVVWNGKSALGGSVGYTGLGILPSTIFARRFASDGTGRGTTSVVETSLVAPNGDVPAVAMDGAGNFTIAWLSSGTVKARRYDESGRPRGAAFMVADNVGPPYDPLLAISVSRSGSAVIVWDGELPDGRDDLFGRRYDNNGVPLAPPFRAQPTARFSRTPTVAADAQGNFVIGSRSEFQERASGLYVQLFEGP